MKHSQLHAVAHNFTDSLASGLGFVVGYCETHVFADAACNPDGFLVVDFLTGHLDEGTASDQLLHALPFFETSLRTSAKSMAHQNLTSLSSRQDLRLDDAEICTQLQSRTRAGAGHQSTTKVSPASGSKCSMTKGVLSPTKPFSKANHKASQGCDMWGLHPARLCYPQRPW